jgi:hypothetical protein
MKAKKPCMKGAAMSSLIAAFNPDLLLAFAAVLLLVAAAVMLGKKQAQPNGGKSPADGLVVIPAAGGPVAVALACGKANKPMPSADPPQVGAPGTGDAPTPPAPAADRAEEDRQAAVAKELERQAVVVQTFKDNRLLQLVAAVVFDKNPGRLGKDVVYKALMGSGAIVAANKDTVGECHEKLQKLGILERVDGRGYRALYTRESFKAEFGIELPPLPDAPGKRPDVQE